MTVSRETRVWLESRFSLSGQTLHHIELLLDALERSETAPTAVRSADEAARVHAADGLAGLEVEELAAAGRIADLGAGSGFPGLVLAAALPGASVDLVEASRRKCSVIERLAAAAGLVNASALAIRAEELAAGAGYERYDAVTARALAPLPVIVEYAAPLLTNGGVLVAWKGAVSEAEGRAGEAAAAEIGLAAQSPRPVVPYAGSRRRSLYVYLKVRSTPGRFPRRAGMALKRPLGGFRRRGGSRVSTQ